MIKRRALIIGNPGENGEENYCEGVHHDINNYTKFLKSPYGGLWDDSEIEILKKPKVATVLTRIVMLRHYDYAKIIYSGHGYYSKVNKTTMLVINKTDEIDSRDLLSKCPKRTLILDCCRRIEFPLLHGLLEEELLKAAGVVDEEQFRKCYDHAIDKADEGFVILNSCSIGEYSRDDENRGGYYSFSLFDAAKEWEQSGTVDENYYKTFSVVKAHRAAKPRVIELSNGEQNPYIEKSKSSENFFPFAVICS